MKVPYVDLKAQHAPLKKEIFKSFSGLFDRADFILGSSVRELELAFADYCGTKYAVGVNSGTDALFLSLKALGIGMGDEVITAPNSFLATATSIVAAGARPVFADVREDMNIDPVEIERRITKRTKAVIPVHLTGKCADMKPILEIARKHRLHVIEDAAQAIGTEYRGKRAGSFGILNCFSLHPLKTLNACGDGGMITTDDRKLCEKLTQLRNIGLKNRTESDVWGYNSRLDSVQALIVSHKFPHLNRWISARRKNAEIYTRALSGTVHCPSEEKHEKCAYHLYVIQSESRDNLQAHLLKNGIDTKIHYPIPIHLQKCAKVLGYRKGDFPIAEKQSQTILSLPIYQSLTRSQLDYVIKNILNFYK